MHTGSLRLSGQTVLQSNCPYTGKYPFYLKLSVLIIFIVFTDVKMKMEKVLPAWRRDLEVPNWISDVCIK
jgi:hypothetical protein